MLSDANKCSGALSEKLCLKDCFRRYAGGLEKFVEVSITVNRWYQTSIEIIHLQRQSAGTLPVLQRISERQDVYFLESFRDEFPEIQICSFGDVVGKRVLENPYGSSTPRFADL